MIASPFTAIEIDRTEECKQAITKFSKALESLQISENENLLMIDTASRLLSAAERSGFVYGVMFALDSENK